MTHRELYNRTRNALSQIETQQTASLIARDLICTFSGQTPEQMLSALEYGADPAVVSKVEDGVRRLLNDEPLAYILGEWEFYGLKLFGQPGCADSPGRYLCRGGACHQPDAVFGEGSPNPRFVLRLRLHRPCRCQPGEGCPGYPGRHFQGSSGCCQKEHCPEQAGRQNEHFSGGCPKKSAEFPGEI